MHRAAARVMAGMAAAAMAVAVLSCGSTNESMGFGGASGGFGGGSSSGSGVGCMTSAACLPGEVCCETLAGGAASCHAGPCPMDMVQLCGMSAECLQAGYACGPTTQPALGSAMVCGPAADSGTDGEGSLADGSDGASPSDAPAGDAPSPGDASVRDGASPGDASSHSDAASDGDSGTSDVVEGGSAGG